MYSNRENALLLLIFSLTFFEKGNLSADQILLPYIRRSRQWLSFGLGKAQAKPEKKEPKLLLNEFGRDGWYGPLGDGQNCSSFDISMASFKD